MNQEYFYICHHLYDHFCNSLWKLLMNEVDWLTGGSDQNVFFLEGNDKHYICSVVSGTCVKSLLAESGRVYRLFLCSHNLFSCTVAVRHLDTT